MRDYRPSTRLLSREDVANIEEVSQPVSTSSLMQFLSLVAALAGGAFLLSSVRKITLSDVLDAIKEEPRRLLDGVEAAIGSVSSSPPSVATPGKMPAYIPSEVRMRSVRLSPEELAPAAAVQSSGVTVGSFGRGGISESLDKRIREKATEYGLNPDDMVKIIAVESGGNPNAISSTGAVGLGQFTARTAKAMGLKNRFDPEANLDATMRLAVANKRSLLASKLPAEIASDPVFLYLSHQIGSGGAATVARAYLSSPDTLISTLPSDTQYSISVNIGGNASTVGQYIEANRRALNVSYVPRATASLQLTQPKTTTGIPEKKASAITSDILTSSATAQALIPQSQPKTALKKPQDIVQTSTGHLVAIH